MCKCVHFLQYSSQSQKRINLCTNHRAVSIQIRPITEQYSIWTNHRPETTLTNHRTESTLTNDREKIVFNQSQSRDGFNQSQTTDNFDQSQSLDGY